MDISLIKEKLWELNTHPDCDTDKSNIWKRVEKGLDYIWDLTPKNLRFIRLHTELFSGENLSSLYFQFNKDDNGFAKVMGYAGQISDLPEKYHLTEPDLEDIGPIGLNYKNKRVNIELVRYQEYISNFYRLGMFSDDQHKVILEIGGGYGALPYHLHKLFNGNATIIMVDLPIILLFAAAYLSTNAPHCKIGIFDNQIDYTDESIKQYDVLLIPHYKLGTLNSITKINYVINTISFAEMTETQLRTYLSFIQPRLKNFLFSQNYEWGQKPSLREVMSEFYTLMPNKEYWENTKSEENILRTYFCTSNKEALKELENKSVKIKNPKGEVKSIKLTPKLKKKILAIRA
jgi:hypothetical protein